MIEETTATSHLSVAITTQGTTSGNAMASSPRGVEFYFSCLVLVIGVVGTVSNALIIYALVASKQHKKHVLIVNQNVLDLFSCIMMVITYLVKLCNVPLIGSTGYWLCMLLYSESLIWCGTVGSSVNLASITVDRYLKVVWMNIRVRNWMIYSAIALSWISSFVYNETFVFSTSEVIDGACYAYAIWDNETDKIIEFVYYCTSYYVIIIMIFIFCYWRILVVIRRQASVMAGYSAAGPSTAQTHSSQIQTNVIKTMIFVSAFFTVLWFPITAYSLMLRLNPDPTLYDRSYYLSAFSAYLYTCTNPFIYATKFHPVKQVLLRLIPCKKHPEGVTENIAIR